MPVEVGSGQTSDKILWKWRLSADNEGDGGGVKGPEERKAEACLEPKVGHVEVSVSYSCCCDKLLQIQWLGA